MIQLYRYDPKIQNCIQIKEERRMKDLVPYSKGRIEGKDLSQMINMLINNERRPKKWKESVVIYY